MKKSKKIIFVMSIIFFMFTMYVFAAEPQLTINIDNTAKPGETKTASINISSEDIEVGIVSGKIEKNTNIISMTVTGKNNWNLTYNKDTGVFNVYKAEGSKAEEIINIEYVVSNEEGTGLITISDIKMTTINYETKEMANISKEITIKNEQKEDTEVQPQIVTLSNIQISKQPTKTVYVEGEKFDKAGMVISAIYSDGTSKEITNYTYNPEAELKTTDKKVVISYSEGEITKTVEQGITVEQRTQETPKEEVEEEKPKDDTTASGSIPQTGETNVIAVTLVGIMILGSMSYIGYKKYKDI